MNLVTSATEVLLHGQLSATMTTASVKIATAEAVIEVPRQTVVWTLGKLPHL